MAELTSVDRYGFPITFGIDFRRAMYRFERHLDSCSPKTARMRGISTLLIDDRPDDAIQELASLADPSPAELALEDAIRRHPGAADNPRETHPGSPDRSAEQRMANVVIPLPIESGGMRVQIGIARTLAAAGFNVNVFRMRDPSADVDAPENAAFARVVQVADQEHLRRELAAEQAAFTMVGSWVDYLPAIEADSGPVVGYSGGEPSLNEDSKLDERMLRFRKAAHALPVHLITCSRFIQQIYLRKFDRKSRYVAAALDERAFQSARKDRPGRSPFRVLLIAWDGLEDKGLGYAIPAVESLRRAGSDIRIVWITPKPPAIFTDLDCELHVDPPQDELYRVIQSCHALVYAPIVDGLGLPPLEAMAAGVPVVVTAGSGPDEFAEDGVNALVVPSQDVSAVKAALGRLIDDLQLTRSLSHHAQKTASRHRPSHADAALLEAFRSVIGHDDACRTLSGSSNGSPT